MRNFVFFIILTSFIILLSSTAAAFIPKTPHLLYLVTEKIKEPVGIVVSQTKNVYHFQDNQEPMAMIDERLFYSFPGRFRSEVVSTDQTTFSIESDYMTFKVTDGMASAGSKLLVDSYTDILLYRDYESLIYKLEESNINTEHVILKRYNDVICYVIGKPKKKGEPFASLWIDKDTFFPVKYVLEKDGWYYEFLYQDWERVSKTWYPLKIRILEGSQLEEGGHLVVQVNVNDFQLKGGMSPTLFDIEQISRLYPGAAMEDEDEAAGQVEELNQSIEEFKKLYE